MAGTQIITASGVIGVSGKPVRVFSVNIISGAQAGSIKFYNGTAASGNYSEFIGTANQGQEQIIGDKGRWFPSGCYAAITNATSVSVDYEQQLTA